MVVIGAVSDYVARLRTVIIQVGRKIVKKLLYRKINKKKGCFPTVTRLMK